MRENRLGVLLRQRRHLARLSRARLARLAGLCEATIKFIEVGRHSPTKQTRMRLLAISELVLTREELGLHAQAQPLTKRKPDAADPFVATLQFHRFHKRIDRMRRRRISQQEESHEPKDRYYCEASEAIEETESAAESV